MSKQTEIDEHINNLTKELNDAKQDYKESVITDSNSWWSTTNAMTMSATVLAFGIAVVAIIAYLIQKGRDPDELLRIFGISLIIVMAVFLVVAGYSDQQISPVMGLLGTIAGYLLGKSTKTKKKERE